MFTGADIGPRALPVVNALPTNVKSNVHTDLLSLDQ